MRRLFFLFFQFYCFLSFAQLDTLQLGKKIDSLMQLDRSNYSNRDYSSYQNVLEESKKIGYKRGILRPHIEILRYYYAHPNIDSIFSYSRQFDKYQKLYPDTKLHLEYLRAMGYILLYKFYLPEYALPYNVDAIRLYNEKDSKVNFKLNQVIADCYLYKGQYDLVIKQIQKVIKDTIHVNVRSKNVMKVSLAIAYQSLEKPEYSKPLLDDVIRESSQNQDSLHYVYAKVFQSHNYYYKQEYQKSIDSLKANFNLLKKYWPTGLVNHYQFSSLPYAKLGQLKKAIHMMRKAIKKSPPNDLPKLYGYLTSYYIEMGKKDSALYYNNQKNHMVDSIRNLEKKIYTEFYETKLEAIEVAKENKKIKLKEYKLSKANGRQKYYIISLFLGVVALIFGSIAFIHYHKKNQAKNLKKDEKKILQNHIKLREDELSATLIGITKKMDGLMEIRDEFKTAIEDDIPEKLKKPIKSFDQFLRNNESGNTLPRRIESQYPGLVMQLKEFCPELSKTDIRHCLLVKLGFSVKDSANLLNVNSNTVKTARYRAKSKLRLPEDVSLRDFLDKELLLIKVN
ncbi:M48 family metallopeptidase [Aquimarina sp. RZ0]|uniref:tetratricopeptide repeat protein n=1 Tax=Aquimarina sp. RZ0 TaxID=2607730 RepID=UPI0011F2074F|nr:hypothetical protein [Aquimarina sp. RZ0]KAA1245281.1 hypothetical protein F0000_12930 [Aquimarina sp. RZ0]